MKFTYRYVLPLFLFAAACGSSSDSDNPRSGSADAGPEVVAPQGATSTCEEMCNHALTCIPEGDLQICLQNCQALSATCRTCVTSRNCSQVENGQCDALCEPQGEDPTNGQDCVPLTYDSGTLGDGTQQGRTGGACFFPGECLSQRCVHAQVSDITSKDFCGNKGDCRSPNNADEECPANWQCLPVSQDSLEDIGIQYLCVPPDIDACPTPGELF